MISVLQKLRDNKTDLVKWGCLVLITLAAFFYCLNYVETVDKFSESYTPDEGNYIKMAQRLLSEHIYSFWGGSPDAYVSPGFPLFLAGCMKLFGTDLVGIHCVKLVQAVLASLTVVLTFVLGRQLTKRDSVGLIAAALIALNGYYPTYCRLLLTENLYLFTMMLFFVFFVYASRQEKKWLHFLAGVLFCVTVMVRPLVVIVGPFLYLPRIVKKRKQWKEWLFPLLLFAGGFVLLALPWWIRNAVTLHRFIPLATQTNPIFAGLAPDVTELEDPGSMLGNLKLLFQLFFAHPLETAYWMTVGKFKIIFMNSPNTRKLQNLTVLVKDVTLYVGMLGCARALFTKEHVWQTVVFLVYLLSSFLFVPTSRYALQYFPFLAIFAGYAAARVFERPRAELQPEAQ